MNLLLYTMFKSHPDIFVNQLTRAVKKTYIYKLFHFLTALVKYLAKISWWYYRATNQQI